MERKGRETGAKHGGKDALLDGRVRVGYKCTSKESFSDHECRVLRI